MRLLLLPLAPANVVATVAALDTDVATMDLDSSRLSDGTDLDAVPAKELCE